ncbi:MAG: GAF domain-containing protein [Candidatus Eremiobacteraeota bacterium]|nr:GAF domain-containing protein [Candidatus Eremiobacteraeota bacterium]
MFENAPDLTKMVKTAIRVMVNDYRAERAVVVFAEQPTSQPPTLGVYGLEGDIWSDPTIYRPLLEQVLNKNKTVLCSDLRERPQIRFKPTHRAAACVPLRSMTGQPLGFFYCDHSQPGALDRHFGQLKDMAAAFDKRRTEMLSASLKGQRKPRRISLWALVVGSLALLCLVGAGFTFWYLQTNGG